MNTISQDILKTLVYFDYFDYPLSGEDICSFAGKRYLQPQVNETLERLVADKIIFKLEEFYSLQNRLVLAEKRKRGWVMAERQLAIATRIARLLIRFPYVETVAVSGSLSKHFADDQSDIDFFIITKADRLWIARTLMHLFKKCMYICGKQHWFCMNYYVDEFGLEIPEKNIFTAMEIVTLLPMEGDNCYQRFMDANKWVLDFLPAHPIFRAATSKVKKNFFCRCIEALFNLKSADGIDKWLMNLTDRRWKKKASVGKLNTHHAKVGMMTNRHFSKPDPKNFQAKVVGDYDARVKLLTRRPIIFI